jgi:hypothetical protein
MFTSRRCGAFFRFTMSNSGVVIPDCCVCSKSGIHTPCLDATCFEQEQQRLGLWIPGPRCARPGMTSNSVPAMRLHPSFCSSGKKGRLRRTGGVLFCSLDKQGRRSAERRTSVAASERDAAAVTCDRSPFGAPPRLYAGIIHPNSAWAALPGITGCKREDPLRHQCSEHLAVRSRAGRA